jgi:hypothetical protein
VADVKGGAGAGVGARAEHAAPPPISGRTPTTICLQGQNENDWRPAELNAVTPGYFSAGRNSDVRGRTFTDPDDLQRDPIRWRRCVTGDVQQPRLDLVLASARPSSTSPRQRRPPISPERQRKYSKVSSVLTAAAT